LQLARGQLANCTHILGDLYYGFGLIVIIFIYQINDQFTYDVRAIKI